MTASPTPGLKHVISVDQFNREMLETLFRGADQMRGLSPAEQPLAGRILATLFYEPSTRTRLSFESAMLRLGGSVVSTENAREFSSAIKGESVEDTVRIVNGYADAIVIRHFDQGAAALAAQNSEVPVINGGDGPGEHPTQALLDLYTIRHELGRIDDLRVALVGDLRFGRAARSLARLLALSRGMTLTFVSPPAVPMGEDVRTVLDEAGVPWREETDLRTVLPEVDVVYQTRIQRERFATPREYASARGVYVIDEAAMALLPERSIVLHPLPRVDEISPAVDSDPRAAYFRQAHNGVFVRMALLMSLLAPPSA